MSKVEFLVKGSASDPYKVSFNQVGSEIEAHCTCPAGTNGTYCKHRFNILNGETKGIISKNKDEVKNILSWFKGSKLESSILELKAKEKEMEYLKKDIQKKKKEVARKMKAAA